MKSLRRVFSFFILLLVFNSGHVCAQTSSDEALSNFVAAGISYKAGQYDEAINLYNGMLTSRWVSGPLYYNLGNAYFKKGDLGRAVLSYERAKHFIPRDSDLRFNRQYVLAKVTQYGNGQKNSVFDRLIDGHVQFYTIDEMVIIFSVLGLAFCGSILIFSYFRCPVIVQRCMMIFLMFSFLIYACGLIIKVQDQKGKAIVLQSTESYFEPRSDSTVHFKLSEGMKARILKVEGKWTKIERSDKKIGWMTKELLEEI